MPYSVLISCWMLLPTVPFALLLYYIHLQEQVVTGERSGSFSLTGLTPAVKDMQTLSGM